MSAAKLQSLKIMRVVGSQQENVEYSFSCNVFAVSCSVFASEGLNLLLMVLCVRGIP